MDLQPLGILGSSTCLRPPEGDGRRSCGTGGTTLERPSRASGAGKSAALQPHRRHQFPKNPTKRNSGLCKAPKPSWSSTQGALRVFQLGKRWKEHAGGEDGADFWEGIPGLGWVCVRCVSMGLEKIPLCYLWYWNFSSAVHRTDGSDRSERIKAGKKSLRDQ